MLRAATIFFAITLLAILFGATGFAGVTMEMGKVLVQVFLGLAILSFIVFLFTGRKPPGTLP